MHARKSAIAPGVTPRQGMTPHQHQQGQAACSRGPLCCVPYTALRRGRAIPGGGTQQRGCSGQSLLRVSGSSCGTSQTAGLKIERAPHACYSPRTLQRNAQYSALLCPCVGRWATHSFGLICIPATGHACVSLYSMCRVGVSAHCSGASAPCFGAKDFFRYSK